MSSKADIDRQNQRIWESHWDVIEKSGTNKKVLIVEGDDDKRVFEALLQSLDYAWTTKVSVGVGGDQKRVLKALKKHPQWYGLVDRDVWELADVKKQKDELLNLTVTEGWCIENHFCVPEALATALGVKESLLRDHIVSQFDGWLRYGAIWWAVQRKHEELFAAFPDPHCGHPTKRACPDDISLRKELANYGAVHPAVDVDRIVAAVNARTTSIQALPTERERIECGIHGKLFFKEVVVAALNQLVKQRDAEKWREEIAVAFKASWPKYLVALGDRLLGR